MLEACMRACCCCMRTPFAAVRDACFHSHVRSGAAHPPPPSIHQLGLHTRCTAATHLGQWRCQLHCIAPAQPPHGAGTDSTAAEQQLRAQPRARHAVPCMEGSWAVHPAGMATLEDLLRLQAGGVNAVVLAPQPLSCVVWDGVSHLLTSSFWAVWLEGRGAKGSLRARSFRTALAVGQTLSDPLSLKATGHKPINHYSDWILSA